MEMIQRDYGVTKQPITARNPQPNGIVERIHQTIGNMLRTVRVHSTKLDKEDPWSGILGAVMFATSATIHSTSRATQAQLVFGRGAMLNVQHEANWTSIKERRDTISSKNNKQENKSRRVYKYNVNDKVALKIPTNLKYGTDAYTGPFKVVQ
eukprot:13929007-Ditylum_brightwellii.AAC.1